jgi:integrase
MYEDARNVGLLETNPFSNLRLPVTEKTQDVHPPSLDEYRQLVAACTVLGGYGAEFRAIVQFAAWTGVRIGELAALHWDDVDGDFIWIRRARKNDGSIGKPKNGRERRIVFLEPARVLDQVPRREDSQFVFHSPRGVPLTKNNHHYAWRQVRAASGLVQARQDAGLPGVRFHDLRHFCATQLLELGLSHFDVSVQLGHEDGGALVMSRYGHPSKEAARQRLLQAFGDTNAVIGSAAGGS